MLELRSQKEIEIKREEINVRKMEAEEQKQQNNQMRMLFLQQQEKTSRILNAYYISKREYSCDIHKSAFSLPNATYNIKRVEVI